MSQTQNFTFSREEIENQKKQLQSEGIQVADMVEVTQDEIARVYAYLYETYNHVVLTNGYFDLSAEQDERQQQAKEWFPSAVNYGMKNEDGSDKSYTFTALAINSNASVANGPSGTCNYDATVRAGYLAAVTSAKAVVVYDDNTACNALAAQEKLLDDAGIASAGYSKGANYNPNDPKTFTLERELMDAFDIPLITSPVYGTPNPTYPQTGDRSELEAALGGKINYDSLRFLVTQKLYDQVMATRQGRKINYDPLRFLVTQKLDDQVMAAR